MFNNALREARMKQGLTIPAAAELLGLSDSHYSRFEAGTHLPSPEIVPNMAEALHCPSLPEKRCAACALGDYQPTHLNSTPMTPQSAAIWLTAEASEMMEHIQTIMKVTANLMPGIRLPEAQARRAEEALEQIIDFEVAAKHFRTVISQWIDSQKVLRSQKEKCRQRGYLVNGIKKEPSHGSSNKLFAYV